MGIAYRCDEPAGIAVSVWHGDVTETQARAHVAVVGTDPRWEAARVYLTDTTTVAHSARPSDEAVAELAKVFRSTLAGRIGSARWAVVGTSIFEQLVMFGMHLADAVPNLVAFSSLASASAWAGLDHDRVSQVIEDLRGQLTQTEQADQSRE
jgi:hypothetical protein